MFYQWIKWNTDMLIDQWRPGYAWLNDAYWQEHKAWAYSKQILRLREVL